MFIRTYRIYGKELERWTYTDDNGRERLRQVEIAYKEYDAETGDLIGAGSEDFSLERYKKELLNKFVYTWDGVKRNKGGCRWFECRTSVLYNRKDARNIKNHFGRLYGSALVELR